MCLLGAGILNISQLSSKKAEILVSFRNLLRNLIPKRRSNCTVTTTHMQRLVGREELVRKLLVNYLLFFTT